jgi:hypothetical protein
MTAYYAAYAGFALFVVLLAAVPRLRTATGVAVLAMGLMLMLATWGRAKPSWLELTCDLQAADSTVIAGQAREDEGSILLWLDADGCPPTLYALPYDAKTAEAMQRAIEEAERNGQKAVLRFEPSMERREPRFHAPPQQALPPKPPGAAPIIVPEEAA